MKRDEIREKYQGYAGIDLLFSQSWETAQELVPGVLIVRVKGHVVAAWDVKRTPLVCFDAKNMAGTLFGHRRLATRTIGIRALRNGNEAEKLRLVLAKAPAPPGQLALDGTKKRRLATSILLNQRAIDHLNQWKAMGKIHPSTHWLNAINRYLMVMGSYKMSSETDRKLLLNLVQRYLSARRQRLEELEVEHIQEFRDGTAAAILKKTSKQEQRLMDTLAKIPEAELIHRFYEIGY